MTNGIRNHRNSETAGIPWLTPLVIAGLLILVGCGGGGGSAPTQTDPNLQAQYNEQKPGIIVAMAQKGYPVLATPDNDSLLLKKADGVLNGVWPYWQYPEGRVGGITVGYVHTGPSAVTLAYSGFYSRNTAKHEIGHAVNNSHFHIQSVPPEAPGHPDAFRGGVPDWPFYRASVALESNQDEPLGVQSRTIDMGGGLLIHAQIVPAAGIRSGIANMFRRDRSEQEFGDALISDLVGREE